VRDGKAGIVYTRTGRAFFNDDSMEHAIVDRLQAALTTAGFWDEFKTTWVCLDCELMPWSAKAQELLRSQYAAVGAAGRAALPVVVDRIAAALFRSDLPTDETAFLQTLKDRYSSRCNNLNRFVDAYRQYCWDVDSVEQLRLAPFHLLATEGRVHSDRTNVWHMETLTKVCSHDSILLATEFIQIDVADPASVEWGIAWWEQLTSAGGEGMVVKPLDFAARNNGRLVQPAIKCRGREYLRIIYGPDYQEPEHLPRLRRRGVGAKRSLALREFALGIEALERFVRKEPLARIHECVFGVLALESEPVDPRL
jgi:protein phosphatase